MPFSWEDLWSIADWWETSVAEVEARAYNSTWLMDYNYNCYLIGVDALDCFLAISVNKITGETKHVGGGHEYFRGQIEF